MSDIYESPLVTRYASKEMASLFSMQKRIETWRRLWLELARAEHALGLPITDGQINDLQAHLTDIDFACAEQREKEVRHDVMAHIYAYGKAAPSAAGILHLGATSCYVTDNGDLILYREAFLLLRRRLTALLRALAGFADRWKALPTLGYTHYQPAQLVTVGKRATLWMQDLLSDLNDLDYVLGGMQKQDSRFLNVLCGLAQSCYRLAQDIRLLQHDRELQEPFESGQIGSSAMAYKRNPMRCERICSLSRYLMVESMNAPLTASAQWLERTLDDSANRRLSLPEAFLCADAILQLSENVCSGLQVNEAVIRRNVENVLPFITTENLLMEAVKRGGDRQQLHELIRVCSMEAAARMNRGEDCDLLRRLAEHPEFCLSGQELEALLVPENYVGRAPEQVSAFLETHRSLWETDGPCGENP